MTEDKIISELESEIKRAEYVDISYVNGVDVDLLSSFLELIKRKKKALDVAEVMKMREILFRGKLTEIFADAVKMRPDLAAKGVIKDGFVYGSLVIGCDAYGCDGYFICASAYMWDESYVNNSDATMFEVDPETVGQYTGLTDKGGTKIFEGDIVRLTDDTGIENTFIITWDSRRAMFYLDSPTFKTDFYYYSANEFEVIGNIHDNPELLREPMKPASKNVAQSGLAPATENFELMPG